jgi:hypothetical protein
MTTPSLTGITTRTLTRTLLAVLVGAGVLLGAVVAASPTAQASTSGTVVYSAQLNIPAPPASNFAGSAGGDGWALAMTPTAVYNVFHHQSTLQVACHIQADASSCWSPETITDGSGNNFATAGMPGLWIDQATGHLFVFATRVNDHTGGVVCIDTTAAATNPNPFCGFTALSGIGESPTNGGSWSQLTDPVVVGTNWYAFNYVPGTPTGTEDQLLCFSLTTLAACASQPYAVGLGNSVTVVELSPSPGIAAFGTQIVIPMNLASSQELACIDTTNESACTGSWPVDTTTLVYPSGSNGSPFPMLDSSGGTTGFCLPMANDPCFGLDGSTVATPSGMTSAVLPNNPWDGPAVTIGSRAYVVDGNDDFMDCWDYSTGASCANFPKALVNSGYTYTVNTDPQRPTCLWTNADGGSAQIQNFDAYTGGACGQGPVRVLAASIVAPSNECIPANYTDLQVTVPARSQYTSGSVQFEDFNGNPIPSIPIQPLDGTGSVNLTPLNLATASPLPQFLITLNGAGSPPEVDVKLTWIGQYSAACTSGGQHVSSGQGYRLAGADGGVFAFGQDAFYGSLTNKNLNGPIVGMASTVDNAGYWLSGEDGGVFAFGDAQYYGGLGASVSLNAPIVGVAATPTGRGYWLVAADGGVFAYGDAGFYGSTGSSGSTADVVGMASTPTGHGYWLVSSDGNIYPFGDAEAHGSMLNKFLAAPISGIAATPSGNGYWMVGEDGGVFAFGDAPFLGSEAGKSLVGMVLGIQPLTTGNGYWLVGEDGGVFAFGSAQFLGCEANSPLNAPLWAISG